MLMVKAANTPESKKNMPIAATTLRMIVEDLREYPA
jgi:hypothetical protein